MKDYWKEQKSKKLNKKKLIIAIVISIVLIFAITISIVYINNENARRWIDKNILGKEISQENLNYIELNDGDNYKTCAFNKYIGTLKDNTFDIYSNTGKKETSLTVEISTPIFTSINRYLAIGEESGQKLYILDDKTIAWEKTIEGNISKISMNKNGYVAVTIVDTSYKTVIEMFDNQGNALFKTFLSTTRVSDVTVSNDNKYLAIAEIDTSGTLIKSNIKIYSIEKGKTKGDSDNSLENTYNGENGDLITAIKYYDKNKLLCMYTDKITVIRSDGTTETLVNSSDKKSAFATINLENYAAIIEEKSSGLFTADSVLTLTNSENGNKATYTTDSVTKEIYVSKDIIALNLGTEIEFINKNGWIAKKYIAEQEITNVIISDSIAGIVYRDRIEIINL